MATWSEFEEEAPDMAAAVRAKFETAGHHVLATIRRDGAPRVSGTEVAIRDGQLTIGSMWQAVKAKDLQRDPRFALHANPGPGREMEGGDAKVAGVAIELDDEAKKALAGDDDPPGPSHSFTLDITEVVLTTVAGDHLDIDLWRPGKGVQRFLKY